MIDSELSPKLTPSFPFLLPYPMDRLIKECIPGDILASVNRGKAIVATAYHLTRRKAQKSWFGF